MTDDLDEILKSKQTSINYSDLISALKNWDPEERAFISHYLQTKDTPAASKFRAKASKALGKANFKLLDTKNIYWDVPFPPATKKSEFTFIDLFAGIGGMRLAFQNLQGKCVFSSEWDKYSQITYSTNFGEIPFGDITIIPPKSIPDHDVLVAGFPCQAFSIAGQKGGFADTRGTLFFQVEKILTEKRPKAFFLENVKGLVGHDKKRTLQTILSVLREKLNYYVPDPQIINACDFGVPQHRERIFIVGFDSETACNNFAYPGALRVTKTISDIKEHETVPTKYYLSERYLETLKAHRKRHSDKGNGFGYEVLDDSDIANAIVVGGMGRERNLLIDRRITDFTPSTNIIGPVNREFVRKMTPREWARLQGFPDRFKIEVTDSQAYKQFGNSVAVPAVEATAKAILKALQSIRSKS
jgi:DNA (cytosine-5)-methyltransferase 1